MEQGLIRSAFGAVEAPDALRQRVGNMTAEDRKEGKGNVKATTLRMVSFAVVVILLVMAFTPKAQEEKLVTAPGILRVYGCELEGKTAEELAEFEIVKGDMPYTKSNWCFIMSTAPGVYLSMQISEDFFPDCDITIDARADYGELTFYDLEDGQEVDRGKNKTVENGKTLVWTGRELLKFLGSEGVESYADELDKFGPVYVQLIAKADDHIVGYAVFRVVHTKPLEHIDTEEELSAWESIPIFGLELIESQSYPMIDGEFQKVTEEYIFRQIELCKRMI